MSIARKVSQASAAFVSGSSRRYDSRVLGTDAYLEAVKSIPVSIFLTDNGEQ